MKTSIRKKQTGKGVIRRNLKFTYAHMYDGVHPDDYLRDKWFKILCQSIINDLSSLHESSSDEDDESEIQTWDFKRQKLTR